MTVDALVDNDVLIKFACYQLLQVTVVVADPRPVVGILGAARYVVGSRLEKDGRIRDREAAQHEFRAFLDVAMTVEPAQAEVDLATEIEEAAAELGLEIDAGESQLFSIAAYRDPAIVITGDKRAVAGVAELWAHVAEIGRLQGRIACLEQWILGVAGLLGLDETRRRVCAEPAVDTALAICLSCRAEDAEATSEGLESYIEDLRARASDLLHGSGVLALPVGR